MTFPRVLIGLGVAFVLLLVGLGAGAWYYLFGENAIDSAELVPANTIFFASIPNGIKVLEGYESSRAKSLLENPDAKPLFGALTDLAGTKNVELFQALLPNLSGQSFIAVTHFDYDHPEKIGLIAAMKPKAGLGDFSAFIEKLRTTWPDIVKQGQTGNGSVDGVDYQWIRGPGAQDKICVAHLKGWIIAAWGEASLQDWIERFRKRSSTSSLVKDIEFQKAVLPTGENPSTLLYLNCHLVKAIAQQALAKTDPVAADYLGKKYKSMGSAALGTKFEHGEIVDRFSLILPRSVQLDCGMPSAPCPFETLNFTGPDTRFYWASGIDWKNLYEYLKDQPATPSFPETKSYPIKDFILTSLQDWVHNAGLDTKTNIVNALGSEVSLQVDWPESDSYPTVGLFVKVDKPNDFKPTIDAIIESARKAYANSGVIQDLDSNGHSFAALQFVQTSAFTPTITKDGSYLGIFLTENQAVQSFQRNPLVSLPHRAEFNTQVGDKHTGATQLVFFDAPYMLNRAYKTALPYISLAGMLDKTFASMLHGRSLPNDLSWLAPMGTWSCVVTPDEEGIQAYSISGAGNQGILLAGGLGTAGSVLEGMGYLPKFPVKPVAPTPANSSPLPVASQPGTLGAAPAVTPNAPASSIIFITADSKIVFNDATVPEDQIAALLKSQKAANPGLRLSIRIDRNALSEVLSTVLDAGISAGFGELPYTYNTRALAPATNSDSAISPPITAASATNLPVSTQPASHATPEIPGAIQPH